MAQHFTRTEILSKFASCTNCAQCALGAWADELGYDEEELYRVAAGFGGGMTRGETCGAVTGSIMALGLRFGGTGKDNKELMHEKVQAYQDEFIKRFGSTQCSQLLDTGMQPGPEADAAELERRHELCPNLVIASIDILEGLMDD